MEARQQLAGDGEAVPAVITLATENDNPLRRQRRVSLGHRLHDAVRRVFHEHDTGNP